MAGCDFLWAACGVVELCIVLCVACVRRCACSDVSVCSGCGCAGRLVSVRGMCVCMLYVRVRCAVRGL